MGRRGSALLLLLLFTLHRTTQHAQSNEPEYQLVDDQDARVAQFLDDLDRRSSAACHRSVVAEWNYASDINESNRQKMLDARLEYARFLKERWVNVTRWDWKKLNDPSARRQFKFLSVLGTSALSEPKLKKYNRVQNDMETIYSTAKVYSEKLGRDISLEPELSEIMSKSRDYDELARMWTEWRRMSGRKIRELYIEFVKLSNEAAALNNFSDTTQMWLQAYESETFQADIEQLWQTLRPLYEQLHAYVRGKLRGVHGGKVSRDGPIPAHILGNMWSQSWGNILDLVRPFPNKPSVDVTPEMKTQNYTPLRMFNISDQFFSDLGLIPMPPEFWEKSVIEKPPGRELVCHASAWDFCNGKDFRIKQCTVVTMEDLITVHHEMGHIQYFLQYKDQPHVFREGANPGFHEAVGDVLALSVATPKHLQKIGLLKTVVDDPEIDINFLMSMALDKIAFLPFGYLMDLWRWGVFSGRIDTENLNCGWWSLRERIQGIKPPALRSELDFDPGAKYHIPSNTPYVRYFVSFVIQFQFHRALCLKAGEYVPGDASKPLHKCDINRNKDAGKSLADMLRLGMSKPWPDAMEAVTGSRVMDASAIREYFRPLEDWLRKKNEENGEYIGWKLGKDCLRRPPIETNVVSEDGNGHSGQSRLSQPDATLTAIVLLALLKTALA